MFVGLLTASQYSTVFSLPIQITGEAQDGGEGACVGTEAPESTLVCTAEVPTCPHLLSDTPSSTTPPISALQYRREPLIHTAPCHVYSRLQTDARAKTPCVI